MNRTLATTRQVRRFLMILGLLLILSTVASALFDLRDVDKQYDQLATEVGRSYFQAINGMREWNYDQGGIYVRATAANPPNPFLKDPLRELITSDNLKLTLINHSQMTRLLSELLTRENGIQLHIMSLTPIRPENKPDSWEQQSLVSFERGIGEEHEIAREGGSSTFRYMAPLKSDDSCRPCHGKPEELAQKIRGGISVAFSYAKFEQAAAGERRRILVPHVLFLCLGLGLVVLVGRNLVQSVGALQDSLLTIKRLEGFLPICAKCKKIRVAESDPRNQDSWVAIENYIEERTDAEFTHGLCPQCSHELYPGLFPDRERPPK